MSAPDPRVNAYRAGLADARLRGTVEAARYVDGAFKDIAVPVAPLLRRPEADAPRDTELLLGERVRVFEEDGGWAWVQSELDSYVGYVAADALRDPAAPVTHRVTALRTPVFTAPDIKSPVRCLASFASRLAVTGSEGRFAVLGEGGFAVAAHLAPLGSWAGDPVAVARLFLEAPYLWGGRSSLGLDCSGLVQLALQAAGIACPRDTDMQEEALGAAVDPDGPLLRGDLVFWKGHVGVLTDAHTLLHANATHMKVAEEPLAQARTRIAETDGPVTSVRRIAA